MREELILALPEVRDIQCPGQHGGNDEGFVDLIHHICQQLIFLCVGHAVLDDGLSCAGVGGFAHVTAGGLVGEALSGSDHSLLQLGVAGRIGGLSLGVDHLNFISHIHLFDHAGREGLAIVGLPLPGGSSAAAPDASRGDCPLNENGEAGLDPLLHADRHHEFVDITDSGDGLAHVRHFPKLGGSALAEVEDHIFCLDVGRLDGSHAVHGVLPDPVAYRGIVGVVLDASYHPVVLVFRLHLADVQFVNFEHLKFERENAAAGVPLDEEDTAVHLFAPDGHAEHLVQALGACYITIPFFTPNFPEAFDFPIQFGIAGFSLKNEAFSDNIPNKRSNDGVHHIGVALQISCSGSDGISAITVRVFGTLVGGSPVRIEAAVVSGIVVPLFLQHLPPCLTPCAEFGTEPSDEIIKPIHGGSPPIKNGHNGVGEEAG